MHVSDRIGRRVKLHDLHVLMAVVQAGSMGKAARHLNTSQSAVSRSIAELEHAFGVSLLDRNRQGIEPTQYGRALLSCGATVFDELRSGVRNIEFLADPTVGDAQIGSNPWLAASFASAVVVRLTRQYPRITFNLVTGYAEALRDELCERRADLLIAWRFGSIADERLDFEFLFNDRCVVAAGAKSPWARRRRMTLADLVDEPWVMPPPGSGITSIAMEAFGACGLKYPRAAVVTDSPHVRMNLLATGRYLTIFPASTLRFSAERPSSGPCPLNCPWPPYRTGLSL